MKLEDITLSKAYAIWKAASTYDEKVYEIIDIINGSTGGGVINNPISEIMELWDHRSCDKAGGNINAHGACLYRIKIDCSGVVFDLK